MSIQLIPKPSVAEEIKRDVVDILRSTLAQAEAGELSACIVIAKRADGSWQDKRSGVEGMSEAIGKLEIVKQGWIAAYLAESD